jgi:hypothetical protein
MATQVQVSRSRMTSLVSQQSQVPRRFVTAMQGTVNPLQDLLPHFVADRTNRAVRSGRAEGTKLELICYCSLDQAEIQ